MEINSKAMVFFQHMADKAEDAGCVKLAGKSDFTSLDADFILRYANADTDILDVASGTGLIVNKVQKHVKSIDCIEPFERFSRFINPANNVRVFNTLAVNFISDRKYDLITFFACMHYFSGDEAKDIYYRFRRMLCPNGKIIIKNQFGVDEDVTIDGFSKEQQTNYYAQYRTIANETAILKDVGFSAVESYDIYPSSCNRWSNTHFYAIVAT